MFVSCIDLTGEIFVDTLQGEDEYLIRAPIGFDDDEDRVYSLIVALSPLAGHADVPGYELIFYVIDAATDETEMSDHWDGNTTRRFLLEAGLRRQIREMLCICVGLLIDKAKPNLVSMTTHTPGLPSGALIKFSEICAVFRSKGFVAGKSDVWHGCHTWMMYRR